MSEISLKRRLVRALEDGDVVRVRDLLEAEREAVSEASMELVSTLCSYLSPHTLQALPHLATCCQDSLVTVARAANPKEVLVSLLEQLDSFQSSELVVKILPSLAAVLARVKPSSMSVSWSWALSTLACHLKVSPPSASSHSQIDLSSDLSHPGQPRPGGRGATDSGPD